MKRAFDAGTSNSNSQSSVVVPELEAPGDWLKGWPADSVSPRRGLQLLIADKHPAKTDAVDP